MDDEGWINRKRERTLEEQLEEELNQSKLIKVEREKTFEEELKEFIRLERERILEEELINVERERTPEEQIEEEFIKVKREEILERLNQSKLTKVEILREINYLSFVMTKTVEDIAMLRKCNQHPLAQGFTNNLLNDKILFDLLLKFIKSL